MGQYYTLQPEITLHSRYNTNVYKYLKQALNTLNGQLFKCGDTIISLSYWSSPPLQPQRLGSRIKLLHMQIFSNYSADKLRPPPWCWVQEIEKDLYPTGLISRHPPGNTFCEILCNLTGICHLSFSCRTSFQSSE